MCVEADNFLARTSGLDFAHTNAYRNFICGLVTDGLWSKFDALYVFYTQDTTTAGLNLVSSSFTITAHGSPGFVADQGYLGVDGDNPSVYLDSGFNAATSGVAFTQNSCHLSVWSLTEFLTVIDASCAIGESDNVSTFDFVIPRYSDGSAYGNLHSGASVGAAVASSIGLFTINRTASNLQTLYRNGTSLGTGAASSLSTVSGNTYVLARDDAGTAARNGAFRIAVASVGGGKTQTDETNFYNRFNTYMSDIANPPPQTFTASAMVGCEALERELTGVGQRTIWWRPN